MYNTSSTFKVRCGEPLCSEPLCSCKAVHLYGIAHWGEPWTPQGSATPFLIKYGTGTAAGRLVSDTLVLAQPPLVLPAQKFGLATEESPDFDAASCDGIFVRPFSCKSIARLGVKAAPMCGGEWVLALPPPNRHRLP